MIWRRCGDQLDFGRSYSCECAEVAQLVERNLAKVEVAGSNPVFRSTGVVEVGGRARANSFSSPRSPFGFGAIWGDVAEWLGTALQKLLHRFDSGRRLRSLERGCLGDVAD